MSGVEVGAEVVAGGVGRAGVEAGGFSGSGSRVGPSCGGGTTTEMGGKGPSLPSLARRCTSFAFGVVEGGLADEPRFLDDELFCLLKEDGPGGFCSSLSPPASSAFLPPHSDSLFFNLPVPCLATAPPSPLSPAPVPPIGGLEACESGDREKGTLALWERDDAEDGWRDRFPAPGGRS